MKIIRIIPLIIMMIMLCSCSSVNTALNDNTAAESETDDKTEVKPVLYKINGDKGNTVYLFGTSEITGKELYPLPDYVTEAYENSSVIAAETDVTDPEISEKLAAMCYYADESKLFNHISAETYGRVRSVIESFSGSYSFTYDELTAAEMSKQLSNIILSETENYGTVPEISSYFIFRGKADGKKITSLETRETLTKRIMPDEYSEYILNRVLDAYSDKNAYINMKNDEFSAYLRGDNYDYLKYLSGSDGYPEDIAGEFDARVFSARKDYFVQRINELIKSGDNVFVTVGAELLLPPSENGIVRELENLGYYVERADFKMFAF